MSIDATPHAEIKEAEVFAVSDISLRTGLSVMVRDARRLMKLVNQAIPGALARVVAASIFEAVAITCLPYTTRGLIDAIPGAHITGVIIVPLIWLGLEAVVVITRLIAASLLRYGTRTIELCAGLAFVEQALEKSCKVDYTCFESREFLSRFMRALQDAPHHGVFYAVFTITVGRTALMFLGCLGLLLWVAPLWTIAAILLAALPTFMLDLHQARRSFQLDHNNMYRNRQAWYVDWLLSTAESVKEVRALGIGHWLIGLHKRTHAPFRDGQLALSKSYFRQQWLWSIASGILLFTPYVFYVISTVRGSTSVGQLLFFLLAFNQCSSALLQMLGAFSNAFGYHLYVHNYLQFLDHEESDPHIEPDSDNVVKHAPAFAINDLWFAYPGSQQPVLRGFTLQIRAGETLALVGRNGIGKTTLVKVLLGLYSYERGTISLDGIDVASQSLSWRRDNIGVVMQDFTRYQFSAGQTVGVGWAPDADNQTLVMQAMEKAQAEGIIAELPNGIDTPLGPAFGGHDLSGGQWQRLALARLFMRRSRLWIMDEPTSAMDPETEERTFRCFRQWTEGRTAIIITHRFSTARIADRIAVVDDGRVVELGTHDELLAARGQYAHMFELQAQAYAKPSPQPAEA